MVSTAGLLLLEPGRPDPAGLVAYAAAAGPDGLGYRPDGVAEALIEHARVLRRIEDGSPETSAALGLVRAEQAFAAARQVLAAALRAARAELTFELDRAGSPRLEIHDPVSGQAYTVSAGIDTAEQWDVRLLAKALAPWQRALWVNSGGADLIAGGGTAAEEREDAAAEGFQAGYEAALHTTADLATVTWQVKKVNAVAEMMREAGDVAAVGFLRSARRRTRSASETAKVIRK